MLTQEEFKKLGWQAQHELAKSETSWELTGEVPSFSKLESSISESVAQFDVDCPLCNNRGSYRYEERGTTTGAFRNTEVDCGCTRAQLYRVLTASTIPYHDRFAILSTLVPSTKSRLDPKRQKKALNNLKANPTQSLAFFGPAGTSKTTFSVALYHHRLNEWMSCREIPSFYNPWGNFLEEKRLKEWVASCPIFRVSAKKLLEDFVRESMHEEDGKGKRIRPVVNREIIARHGSKAALFIEELDKVKYTEFKTAVLFELIDACYEHGAQLVFSTNLTPEKFAAQFGEETGPAIARRISEMCTIYNFFEND